MKSLWEWEWVLWGLHVLLGLSHWRNEWGHEEAAGAESDWGELFLGSHRAKFTPQMIDGAYVNENRTWQDITQAENKQPLTYSFNYKGNPGVQSMQTQNCLYALSCMSGLRGPVTACPKTSLASAMDLQGNVKLRSSVNQQSPVHHSVPFTS